MKKFGMIAAAMVFITAVMFGCGIETKNDLDSKELVHSVTATPTTVVAGGTSTVTCDAVGDISWSANGGTIVGSGASIVWTAPVTEGSNEVTCSAAYSDRLDSKSAAITVTKAPKWTLVDGAGIQSSDMDAAGEIYSVTRGNEFPFTVDNNLSIVKFNSDGSIAWNKNVQIPGYEVAFVDFIRLSPDGNIIYLFWRKPDNNPTHTGGGFAVSGFDSNGNHLWTTEIDPNGGYPKGAAVDNTGVYAAAHVSFYNDTCVLKLDLASGKVIWQKSVSGTIGTGLHDAIAVSDGYLYITGVVGSVFPGHASQGGDSYLYVAKYDTLDGRRIWATEWGPSEDNEGTGITVVPAGDFAGVYVAGRSKEGLAFEGRRFLVQKYDFDGNLKWSKDDYFDYNSAAWHITADSTGLYVSGTELFKLNFDGTVVWNKNVLNFGSDMFVRDGVLFTTYGDNNYISRYYDVIGGEELH